MLRIAMVVFAVTSCGGEPQLEKKKSAPPPLSNPIEDVSHLIDMEQLVDNHVLRDEPVPKPKYGKLSLLIRSTPSGASVKYGGRDVGTTPTYLRHVAAGKQMEIEFSLSGYQTARYRFIPVRDGVIHGTMKRTMNDTADTP